MTTTKKSKPVKNNPASPKSKSDAAADLMDLFEDGLKDLYWAEKALVKSLPKLAKNAANQDLQSAIEIHLQTTNEHVTRLTKVFELIEKKPIAKKCDAMEGLIEEANGILKETEAGVVRDAGIIAASQKIEHYEIASYGTLRAFAEVLGLMEVEQLLAETLQEEKDSDAELTILAVTAINAEAVEAD